MSIISTTRALDTKETKREIILIDIHNPITHRNKETIVKAFVKEFQQVLLEVKSRNSLALRKYYPAWESISNGTLISGFDLVNTKYVKTIGKYMRKR